jgi:serine/threonine protein phosphatase 1
MRKIAISDIHGCLDTFKALLDQVGLSKSDALFLLGDFVDRGPASKGVFDYIMHLREEGYQVRCLMGNHEDMMVRSMSNFDELEMWLLNGGNPTLESFGVSYVEDIPAPYIDFINQMEYYIEVDDYLLVHAGINFVPPNSKSSQGNFLFRIFDPLQDKKSLLWIRDWHRDIDRDWLGNRTIVHGHTPLIRQEIVQMHKDLEKNQVLDIDNGGFATFQDGMGHLCAFDMTNRELYFQKNIEPRYA